MNTIRTFVLTLCAAMCIGASALAAELVMVEQRGCIYCKMWHEEVGPEYSKTPEGAVAPIRHIDLNDARPAELTFAGPLRITPTFVLMIDNREAARIEGYPGEDFFWGLLGRMLRDHANFTGGTG